MPVGYGPKRAVQTGAAVRTAGDGHMNNDLTNRPPRILIVDDNAAIHSDFRKTLGGLSARGDSSMIWRNRSLAARPRRWRGSRSASIRLSKARRG